MIDAMRLRRLEPAAEMLFPFVAFLLAFILRRHFLNTYHFPMMLHEQDAVGYMETAGSIMHGRALNMAGRPPGYPAVIALFALLPVPLEYAARLASIFMDALAVVPLYALARGHLSRIPSFAVALLWAVFSFALYFSTSPLSQSSYLCYLLTAVVLLREGVRRTDLRLAFGGGLFFALSFLARPEGIVGFGCGLLLCLLPLALKGGRNRKGALLPLLFLLGFLLPAFPYFVSFHHQMGYWGITAKTEAALKTLDGTMILNAQGELGRTAPGKSVWKEYYGSLPVFLEAVRENVRAFGIVYLRTFPLWMHLASLAGLLALLRKERINALPYLLILLAVLFPNLIVNIPKTHSYLYSAFALFMVFLVTGLELPFDLLRRGAGRLTPSLRPIYLQTAATLVILAVVLYVCQGFYRQADESYLDEAGEALRTEKIFKEPAELIKANSEKGDVIMTRWGLVGYFADRNVVMLPKGGVQAVIDYGRRNGARFVLIDTDMVLSRRQELRELLHPLEGKEIDPAYGLEVLFRNYYPEFGGFVVYRYLPQRS